MRRFDREAIVGAVFLILWLALAIVSVQFKQDAQEPEPIEVTLP